MVFRVVEGSITSLGSISGTDTTPVSIKEDTRALRVFLENPFDAHDQTVINTTASGSNVQILGEGTVSVSTSINTITVSGNVQADHGELTGLSDDDHIQYILAAGTRSLTGDWDNTGFRIRNTGTAEVIPTAPPSPVTGLFWLDTSEPALDTEILTLQTSYDNADGVIVTSGSKPVDIQGVSGLTSTLIVSPTGTFSESLTISGASVNIQGPIAKPFVGFDGITVASGVHFDSITGFKNEFLSSSGSLQTQIDAGITDHTNLTNIGTTTHAQIDTNLSELATSGTSAAADIVTNTSDISALTTSGVTHEADATIHFTEGSIDHGSITGLDGDDHPQYGQLADNETAAGIWNYSNGLTVSGTPISIEKFVESWTIPLSFPGSGIDGTGDGSENVTWTVDYPMDTVKVTAKLGNGSLTYSVRLNNVLVQGLNDQGVTTTESIDLATSSIAYTADDEIIMAVSGAIDASNLRWTLKTRRT